MVEETIDAARDLPVFRDIRRYTCGYCGIVHSKKAIINTHIQSHHQKYDPDAAAKAAVASVLASKLGADSGLKVLFGDELQQHYTEAAGKSHDVELVNSSGLRKRNVSEGASMGGNDMEMSRDMEDDMSDVYPRNQSFVEHDDPIDFDSGGWFNRLALLLLPKDRAQSYTLICGNCHMSNGIQHQRISNR